MADIKFPDGMRLESPKLGNITMMHDPASTDQIPTVAKFSDIRSLFTGEIAAGNEGFPSAGAVYVTTEAIKTALAGKADAGDLTLHVADASNPHKVTASQLGLGTIANDLQNEVDNRVAQAIANFSYDTATRKLTVFLTGGTEFSAIIPLADLNQPGLMAKEDVATLTNLVTTVQSIAEGGVWRATFNTYADMLLAYPNLDVTATNWLGQDFLEIVGDENYDPVTKPGTSYIVVDNGTTKTLAFRKLENTPIVQATNESLGVIKGSIGVSGKVYVEVDGTVSVYGWDALVESMQTKTGDASNNTSAITEPADDTPPTSGETLSTLLGKIIRKQSAGTAMQALTAVYSDGSETVYDGLNPKQINIPADGYKLRCTNLNEYGYITGKVRTNIDLDIEASPYSETDYFTNFYVLNSVRYNPESQKWENSFLIHQGSSYQFTMMQSSLSYSGFYRWNLYTFDPKTNEFRTMFQDPVYLLVYPDGKALIPNRAPDDSRGYNIYGKLDNDGYYIPFTALNVDAATDSVTIEKWNGSTWEDVTNNPFYFEIVPGSDTPNGKTTTFFSLLEASHVGRYRMYITGSTNYYQFDVINEPPYDPHLQKDRVFVVTELPDASTMKDGDIYIIR